MSAHESVKLDAGPQTVTLKYKGSVLSLVFIHLHSWQTLSSQSDIQKSLTVTLGLWRFLRQVAEDTDVF